jgi:hypothetical protein
MMSPQYRLMSYFAVATMHFYRKDIVALEPGETLGSFADKNKKVIDRVIQEAKNLFNYELSHEQVGRAIEVYVIPGQSVSDHPPATLEPAG